MPIQGTSTTRQRPVRRVFSAEILTERTTAAKGRPEQARALVVSAWTRDVGLFSPPLDSRPSCHRLPGRTGCE